MPESRAHTGAVFLRASPPLGPIGAERRPPRSATWRVRLSSITAAKHCRRRTTMLATVLYGPRDIRLESRETPRIVEPTDAVIRISATCVCGSDLWPYRGLQRADRPLPMGHEYCGIVGEVGSAVRSIRPGHSSSARSRLRTISVRTASTATSRRAGNASSSAGHRRRCCACRWPMARW
mgnify:FL=1